ARISVLIRIAAGLNRHPLWRLEGIDRPNFPVPQHIPFHPVPVLEEGNVIDCRNGDAMTTVNCRIGAVIGQVLKVLCAAWSQHGGEEIRRAVINRMTPSVRTDKL